MPSSWCYKQNIIAFEAYFLWLHHLTSDAIDIKIHMHPSVKFCGQNVQQAGNKQNPLHTFINQFISIMVAPINLKQPLFDSPLKKF